MRTGACLAASALALGLVAPAALASPRHVDSAAPGGATLQVVVTDHNTYVVGPTTFGAGRVNVSIDNSKDKDVTIAVGRLLGTYTWKQLRHDLGVAFQNLFAPGGNQKKGLRALNRAIDNTESDGGLDVAGGKTGRFSAVLSHPGGRYFVWNDTNLPKQRTALTVTAGFGPQTLPKADGRVVAKTNRRFAGDKVLPAKGRIKFVNRSTESPHFLELQHVKKGTTRKEILDYLRSGSNSPPPFGLPEGTATGVVGSHQKMTFHVILPPGTYAELCFFPDPKEGMPHALMGMIRIVHLK